MAVLNYPIGTASRAICCSVALLMFGVLAGCGAAPFHQPPPPELHDIAVPVGYSDIRFWGDVKPRDAAARVARRKALLERRFAAQIAAREPIKLSYLALSGGGADGAFGAGFLNGWTQSGTRPEFEMVTGISTGALIAPFAFLGPD